MPNPMSDRGISDRDYAAAIGTLVGEAGVGANIRDYQAIADVIANRLDDRAFVGQYGKSIAAQTMRANEFSAWSSKEKHANLNARLGFAAALDPKVISTMPSSVQERVSLAKQAVNDVFVSSTARGITQGATFYDNPEVTAQLGTGGFHNRLDRQNGSVIIGDHRFTGPGFRADQPFDPVTYNGQLGIPDAALPDFSGVAFNENPLDDWSGQTYAAPSGQVDFGGYIDAPASYGDFGNKTFTTPNTDFSLSYDAPDFAAMDREFTGINTDARLADMRTAAYDSGFYGQQPLGDMPDIMSQFDQGAYPSITDGLFPGDENFSVPVQDVPDFSLDNYNHPDISEMAPIGVSGFHTGFDDFSPVPDFNAPSLAQRNEQAFAQDRIDAFENGHLPGISYGNIDQMNADLMSELAPSAQAPAQKGWGGTLASISPISPAQAAPAPVASQPAQPVQPASTPTFDPQAMAMGDWEDKIGVQRDFSLPSAIPNEKPAPARSLPSVPSAAPSFARPAATPTPPARPSLSLPSAPRPATPSVVDAGRGFSDPGGWSLGGLDKDLQSGLMDGSAYGAYGPAPSSSIGPFGWGDKGLTIGGYASPAAAISSMFGSAPTAPQQHQPQQGFGWGDMFSGLNPFSGFSGPGWNGYDAATMGYGFGYNDRGERSHSGMDNSGNATVGDGSYGSQSGVNDNNPQGIL